MELPVSLHPVLDSAFSFSQADLPNYKAWELVWPTIYTYFEEEEMDSCFSKGIGAKWNPNSFVQVLNSAH